LDLLRLNQGGRRNKRRSVNAIEEDMSERSHCCYRTCFCSPHYVCRFDSGNYWRVGQRSSRCRLTARRRCRFCASHIFSLSLGFL